MEGYHSFYAGDIYHIKTNGRQEVNYFLGGFVGDHVNDEAFSEKIKRITNKIAGIYGYGNFCSCWSLVREKPIVRLSPQQRFTRMKTMAYNKYKKKCSDIIKGNSLFVSDELEEAKENYEGRIIKLQLRYFTNNKYNDNSRRI